MTVEPRKVAITDSSALLLKMSIKYVWYTYTRCSYRDGVLEYRRMLNVT